MTSDASQETAGLAAARREIPTLFPYLKQYRRTLVIGVACVLITAATASVLPLLVSRTLKHITQHLAGSEGLGEQRLILYFLAILGFALLSAVFRFYQRWILIGISRKVEYDLRNDLFAHLLRLPPAYFDRMTTGDIIARATNDLNQVRSMLGPGLMYPINAFFTMACVLAGMCYLSPVLTLVALFPPLLMAFGTNRLVKVVEERFTLVQEQFSKISTYVQENLTGIRVVKAYVREDAEVEAIRDLNRDYLEKNLSYFRAEGALYPFFAFSHNLGRFVVLGFGSFLMMSPRWGFDVGDFAAFLIYLNMLLFPMISIGWVLNVIQRGVVSLQRINEVMDTEPSIKDPADPCAPPPTRGEIVFRDVTFEYIPGRPVLRSLNLEIPAGATVGIVGATGSGKSTLAHLVPRLQDPVRGEILIDGVPARNYRLKDLRKAIGLVSQDHFMFSATVRKNIAFGLSPEEFLADGVVEEASRLAALHDNVIEFPQGYETLVGERGITLSGGQRQRAAIAR
ncbi:MAG: ABC transporter ATP-binding protein, partial [Candidatus Omnitrophica bacterium]|nr:ABC transporter ATP-binding protein [Candidatus Omnitrophota bacterium]